MNRLLETMELSEEVAVDEEETDEVKRVGKKSVASKSTSPMMAPLARLESDFDVIHLATSPKRKQTKCKSGSSRRNPDRERCSNNTKVNLENQSLGQGLSSWTSGHNYEQRHMVAKDQGAIVTGNTSNVESLSLAQDKEVKDLSLALHRIEITSSSSDKVVNNPRDSITSDLSKLTLKSNKELVPSVPTSDRKVINPSKDSINHSFEIKDRFSTPTSSNQCSSAIFSKQITSPTKVKSLADVEDKVPRPVTFWPTTRIPLATGNVTRSGTRTPMCCDGHRLCFSDIPVRVKSVGTLTTTKHETEDKEVVTEDVSSLVELFLSQLYVPFQAARPILIKEARDILLCQFAGDYFRFRRQFLQPVKDFLRAFVQQHRDYHADHLGTTTTTSSLGSREVASIAANADNDAKLYSRKLELSRGFSRVLDSRSAGVALHPASVTNKGDGGATSVTLIKSESRPRDCWLGWPLCYDQRVLVHLTELDSDASFAPRRSGDFYFYLRHRPQHADTPTSSSSSNAADKDIITTVVQLTLRYRVLESGQFREKTIRDYKHFLNIMERTTRDKDNSDFPEDLDDVDDSASSNSTDCYGEDEDSRISSILRHLLMSVERGIERLRWDKMKINVPIPSPTSTGQASTPRLSMSVVDTRDCSVQTSPCSSSSAEQQLPIQTLQLLPSSVKLPCESDLSDSIKSDSQSAITELCKNEIVQCQLESNDGTMTREGLQSSVSCGSGVHSTLEDGSLMTSTSCVTMENVCGEGDEKEVSPPPPLPLPVTISQVDQDLLHSRTAILTGSRDKCGRSLVFLFPGNLPNQNIVQHTLVPSKLAELLRYFAKITKSEIAKKGLVILVDLSCEASIDSLPLIDNVIDIFQANDEVCIERVLLWTPSRAEQEQNEETLCSSPFPKSQVSWEMVKSGQELSRFVNEDQLVKEFGGSYGYDHQEWIGFRKFVEPFVNGCRLSSRHLVGVMRELSAGVDGTGVGDAAATRRLIEGQKRHIHSTYQDEQLRHLDEEGETILRELTHYSAGAPNNQHYKEALEHSGALYGELRRSMNELRKLAEKRLKSLEECLRLKTLAEESSQVLSWLCRRGEESLCKHQVVADSLPAIKHQEEQFEKFYFLAMRQIEKGNDLLEEAALVSPPGKKSKEESNVRLETSSRESANDVQELTSSLKERLHSFSERLEETRERLEDTAKCYHLLDQVYSWALNTMKFISEMKLERVTSSEYQDIIGWTRALDAYVDEHPPIADEVFREMILLAKASSPTQTAKLLQQCQAAQARCQETVELLRARRTSLVEAARTLSSQEDPSIHLLRFRRDSSSSEGNQQKDFEPLVCNKATTTRSRSHPQNFWPRGSSTPSSTSSSGSGGGTSANRNSHSACSDDSFDFPPSHFYRQQNYARRRSMSALAGPPPSAFSSPFASYTSFPSNPYPSMMATPRDCALQMDQYLRDKEEQLQSRGLITEDLTTRGPVASIDKDDSRWTHNQNNPNEDDTVNTSSSSCIPRSSTGSRVATKGGGSPPGACAGSSLHHPVTQKPQKKHMRICPTWQLCEEALHKAAQQVRRQNERLVTQHKLQDERHHEHEDANPDACADPQSAPTEVVSRSSSMSSDSPIPVNSHLLVQDTNTAPESGKESPEEEGSIPKNNNAKTKSTLMLIMGELIQTERDYVKSLEYIIENYCPELLREDIPQALRGQRNVIFGNIEKIYEFHSQYFLQELERCEKSPFRVGQYFLEYERQFYLYALYNKNKPKSDNLMSEYGTAFFREKQLELKDKMDLASYLLKPVQRMGKYALLLKQLLKECPEVEKEAEYQDLKAAEEMVRFQLRHGNDLLAMDALRDCDVNVKEQGRLLRQDEFLVWQGRYRKSLRRVFLFEELILFSKARRDPEERGLQEIYQYKQSIKTTDIGMTEQIGDSPTKFEIWFRKRKLHDTYMLQAANAQVKQAWAHEISRLLWKQALKNREIRLAEMSSMGIGNKPCLDIKPSEDQISDRSIRVESVGKATSARFRNSVSGYTSSLEQMRTNKRPHSIISVSSSSSSGSSCGNAIALPPGNTFAYFGAALNLAFDPGDVPPSHHRSETQQSQCSTESGFCTDTSLMGDGLLSECEQSASHGSRFGGSRCRRSDSVLSNDSVTTQPPSSSSFDEFDTSNTDTTNATSPQSERNVTTQM